MVLAETFLVGVGAGGVLVVNARRQDADGRDEHGETAADHGLAVESMGVPGHARARADQVRVVFIDRGLAGSPGRLLRQAH